MVSDHLFDDGIERSLAPQKKQRRVVVRDSSAHFDGCFGVASVLMVTVPVMLLVGNVDCPSAWGSLGPAHRSDEYSSAPMPRRPAKVTQGEIARVIRAAKEAGAVEVVIDGEGQIRVVLSADVPAASMLPSKEDDDAPVWTMSAPAKKKRWSSRDATSWRDIPKRLPRP